MIKTYIYIQINGGCMKKHVAFVFIAALFFTLNGFCKNSSIEIDQKSINLLNPQDVPVFYENNPLRGLKAFTVITSFPLKENKMQKQIGQSIEKALSGMGEVIHLKDNDMRGFGVGNVLLIQLGAVKAFDGKILPISRASLGLETAVCIDKTGLKSFPIIWSINTFFEGNLESCSEQNIIHSIQYLIQSFSQSFKEVNQEPSKKIVFYIYE